MREQVKRKSLDPIKERNDQVSLSILSNRYTYLIEPIIHL